MDPVATYLAWCEAVKNGDLPAVRALRDDYNTWMSRIGFPAIVRVAPHTDLFMRGVRSGTVDRLGDKLVTLTHPLSGTTHRVHPSILSVTTDGEGNPAAE